MTNETATRADLIQQAFAPLIGMPAWLVKQGHASCITLEFGQPHLFVREPRSVASDSEAIRRLFSRRRISPRGEWHLWIYCCNWRVFSAGQEVACSESPDERIKKAAYIIDGQLLTAVRTDHRQRTSEFSFEADTRIYMWPYDDDRDSPQWMLFMKSGAVLTYRSDGLYSLGPSETPDKAIWNAPG